MQSLSTFNHTNLSNQSICVYMNKSIRISPSILCITAIITQLNSNNIPQNDYSKAITFKNIKFSLHQCQNLLAVAQVKI